MRVARRSHLSRITAEDDWSTEPWWYDESLQNRALPANRNDLLYGPQIAPAANNDGETRPDQDSPFIEAKRAKDPHAPAAAKRRQKRR